MLMKQTCSSANLRRDTTPGQKPQFGFVSATFLLLFLYYTQVLSFGCLWDKFYFIRATKCIRHLTDIFEMHTYAYAA